MPIVNVHYRKTNLDPQLSLKDTLATIVANRLNVGDAPSISVDNIIIFFQKLSHLDVCKNDVVILVTAHNYPDRVKKHLSITAAIASDVAKVVKNSSFSVIVNLTPLESATRELTT